MTLTLKDLSDRLSIMDEISVLELLNITSDQLVDRFEDVIQQQADKLEKELREDNLFYEEDEEDYSSEGQ